MSLDLNAIRDEDEISKVTLAQEIERTRQLFHSCDGELQTQIDLVLLKANNIIDKLEEKNGAYMEQLDSKFKGTIEIEQDKLQELLTNSTSAYGRKLDEFTAINEKKINDIYILLSEKIDTNDERNKKTIQTSLDGAKKELDMSVNNSVSQLTAILNNYKRATDLRFNGLDQSVQIKATQQVDKHLGNISITAKNIEKSVEDFKKNMRDLMTKYQTETMSKVSLLEKRFEDTRLKFALISDSLKKG